MSVSLTLVDPAQKALIAWFSSAQIGDKCHVVNQSQQTYMYLIKLSPIVVQWQMPVAMNQGPGVSGSMKFLELLQNWEGELTQV